MKGMAEAKRELEQPPEAARCKKVEIREMEIDDLAAVFHLGERLFKAETAQNLYRTWDQYEVVDLFSTNSEYCLVADVDDEVAGFALGTTIEKDNSAWKYGLLVWLGVDPRFQRLGVAGRLFRRFRDLMLEEGVRILVVDTEADNDPALRFFERMGFCNPRSHVYLSLNLDEQKRKRATRRRQRTRSRSRAGTRAGMANRPTPRRSVKKSGSGLAPRLKPTDKTTRRESG